VTPGRARTCWETGFRILEKAGQRYPYKRATLRKRKAVLNYRIGKVRLQVNRYLSGIVHLGHAFLLDPQRAFKVIFGLDKSR